MTTRPKPTSSHRNRPFSSHSMSNGHSPPGYNSEPKVPHAEGQPPHRHRERRSPFQHYPGQHTRWIKPDGESHRRGVHPLKFLKLCFRSSNKVSNAVNVLWPVVPAAIAVHFARPDWHLAIFVLNYIAMVPAANLLGYAGQELSRKLPKVFGVLLETTLGSLVEIILFIVLIARGDAYAGVVRAAILGSILANLLLCLGMCFAVGGLRDHDSEQSFHPAISEVGSGLMLVAGMGLIIPAIFSASLTSGSGNTGVSSTDNPYQAEILSISRGVAVMLLTAFVVYVVFQMRSNHGLYDDIFEQDELQDRDRHKDLRKEKLTFTECILALLISLACVALIAVFLVEQIEWLVLERHVSDAFVGLILVPLVEKAAEHLTAIDEAWDNQMNFALSHVLGASIQTALLNTPIVVIVGWGLHREFMDLNFKAFDAVVLILAILVVGNFLRDGKSNYLEGFLCVTVYIIIAISAYYYPDPPHSEEHSSEPSASEGGSGGEAAATEVARLAVRTAAAMVGVNL